MFELVKAFTSDFGGTAVLPDAADYDSVRAVWNGLIDHRPALIARCRTDRDIADAIRLTRESGLPLAVRGGGHSVAGLGSCTGGVVIDLSGMRGVAVDPGRRLAAAEGGATWSDYDAATGAFALASTGGLISTTGVGGLTLGGGIGWLQRKYGLACDNLVGADVVTADGRIVRADEDHDADLLWALRGGGGNFGVVARFTFNVHPVANVLAGMVVFPFGRAREVLTAFRDWVPLLPDELSMLAAILTAPPEPFVPPQLVGQKVVALMGCWCGDLEEGARVLAPMRDLEPAVDLFGPMPYPVLQSMLDGAAPPGVRDYFRGGFLDALDDAVIDAAIEHGARMPSPMSAIHFHNMGGAVARVGTAASAYPGRAAAYTYNLVTMWVDETQDEANLQANHEAARALRPFTLQGRYVNFLEPGKGGQSPEDRARAVYGDGIYSRLAELKAVYDPDNLFQNNINILPA
jgi:FAD/FMN-containing dehydrogenase